MRKIAATLLAGIMAAGAQQPAPQQQAAAPDGGIQKITATFQMVVETVTVNDKSGKPIEGLKAEDFTITENGTPQKIQFCEFQKLPEPGESTANFSTRPEPPAPKPENKAAPVTAPAIAPEPPGQLNYRNKRLLALYFDMSAMPVPDQLRAF